MVGLVVTPVMVIVYSVKASFTIVTSVADKVPLEIVIFSVVLSSFQAPALKVKVASPVKLRVGVSAEPCALEVPNFTHCLAAYPFVNDQPWLSADVVIASDPAALPPHDLSLPPVPAKLSKVSEKIVVVSCPHALLPNTKEATISRQRRDIVIPVLQKSFSINFYF